MPLDFPTSPTNGQTYTSGSKTWVYDSSTTSWANSPGVFAVANGGTGASTLAANNVLLGNDTSALQTVAPGTSGNVLTSNGTTWTSSSAPAVGSNLAIWTTCL